MFVHLRKARISIPSHAKNKKEALRFNYPMNDESNFGHYYGIIRFSDIQFNCHSPAHTVSSQVLCYMSSFGQFDYNDFELHPSEIFVRPCQKF